jgi:tetratricopeptide (TPR) repeat protein
MFFGQPPALQDGLTLLRDGKLAEARISFEKALQTDPRNAFAWVSLAETCRRLGDTDAAQAAALKAEQSGTNIPPVDHALASFYAQQGQLARAAAFEEKYAASPKADPQAGLRTAELYQRAGDNPNAERILKSLWEKRGKEPLVAFSYAQVLLRKLDFSGAQVAISAALAANPKDPQLVLVTGVAHYGQRRFPEAIDDFLQVIAIDPSIPQPYAFIGKMMEQAGPKLPEITSAFAARVKSAPDDAIASLVLAKARLAADSKDPQAETLLRASISIDPSQWESHYELGVLLEGRHAYKEAAAELSRSIELDPKQSMPHYHLARVYDRLGESEKAQAERKLHQQLSNSSQ